MPSVKRNVLQAAAAAGAEERLGVLEVVVKVLVVAVDADRRRDDLAGRQRRTVVHRHDADAVDHDLLLGIERVGGLDRTADDHRIETLVLAQVILPVDERLQLFRAAGFKAVDHVFGDHREERDVDRVDAFAQDRPLAAALTQHRLVVGACRLAAQEAPRILKVVARHDLAQRLARRQAPRRRGHTHSRSCLAESRPAASCECGTAIARIRNAAHRARPPPETPPRRRAR